MTEYKQYNIVIRESPNHFSPIGVDWWKGFNALKHKTTIVYNNNDLYQHDCNIDLFVNMMDITDPDVTYYINLLKKINPTAKVVSTVVRPLDKLIKYFDLVDLWFDCGYKHPYYEEWFTDNNQRFLSVLEATDDTCFFKGSIEDESYIRDYSFIGQFGQRGHGYRCEDKYLYPLIDNNALTSYLFGFEYKHIPLQHINYIDVNTIFNCTKINLNFHYLDQKNDKLVLNKRTFDIAASGNFQLIDHPLYEDLFGLKAYPNHMDYIDAFYYYLARPEERNLIALQAQKIVLNKHTWSVRMKNLLNDVYNL